ncbi:TlpA family protein disulfide reductase [Flavobacterium selenitireducens]|uniref:TlpA family protein disulfide reductase n=1 Tax=Flavobacterium selenitireducens TaxID=2722704 RepID=UPI00168B9EB1|nr:TlpA disulfide reductase family protein [Flavobacterium selenitireducens]MBD3584080.1 TlpA family protein disulfide reductase [Flavobacterium selenitireducens]
MKIIIIFLLLNLHLVSFAQPDYQNRKIRLGTKPNLKFDHWIANIPNDKNLEGKFIVLEFWATWCEPCLKNVEHLNKLQSKFNNPNLYFISITDEEKNVVQNALKKVDFNSIVVSDKRTINSFWNGGLSKLVIPFTILIDDYGLIKWIGDPSILNERLINEFITKKLTPFSIYENSKR